ncbi:hypothetical protein KIN20_030918 [Parelaphostrongylus tenuis]|uniref:Uncharacterized protein n=1 Tax=Parelaphostrongylus tenuis TaxID=148309 RepID=A0AAD5R4H6_PARTN|nr:hypothetical protein KIN20_030915 [Parelaphostrongylus tenuis]KAJ1369453.1 hypothetical protein KIN20_030918 [Parelaphostrongylus tenuis]
MGDLLQVGQTINDEKRYCQQLDHCNQTPSTSPPCPSHSATGQCKATRCQGNKEEVERDELGAIGSYAVIARSVFIRFPSFQITGALVKQEEVLRNQTFASRIDWLVCIEG